MITTKLTNEYIVVDNVISREACDDLIVYYAMNFDKVKFYDRSKTNFLPIVDHISHLPIDSFVEKTLKPWWLHLASDIMPQRAHIESREPGSGMPAHTDTANPLVVMTSVTYLNDDYEGGQTFIRPVGEKSDRYDILITPKAGRTVWFNGTEHVHGVMPFEGTNRYTLPIWYRDIPYDLLDDTSSQWWW